MKTKAISIIFVIIFLLFTFSCASTPSRDAISFGYTPQEKYEIGRTVGANILGTYNLYYNEELYSYLNSVCNSIIINSDNVNPYKGYSIGVLDTNIINAFATPAGHVLISRGMLKSANSEDELAAIIAHELSHIQLEHSIKAIKKNRTSQTIGRITTGILATIVGSRENATPENTAFIINTGLQITNYTSDLINSGYSKDTEFQADKYALHLMKNTGYNPNAMLTMLKNLKNNKSRNYRLGFDKTHPKPNERILKSKKTIRKIKRQVGKNYDYNEESRAKRFEEIKQYF